MSKINQIETSLKEIDATTFHKLMDAYLVKKYAYPITSNGTKLGEDKPTTGTPDSYASLDNGDYIFAEYTTQKASVANKFLKDLDKCFKEEKTGIPINKIKKIILACNSDLNPSEVKKLYDKCEEQDIDCTVLGNSTIANDLSCKYPSIAKDYLNIEIDTGQILDYSNFIENYNSSKFSTPLNTLLLCRKEEFDTLCADIENLAIVLITGVAGIGKTKLALEVCKKYSRKNNVQFKTILNKGVNIFDDIKTYFNENESYLILIDDVNRAYKALEYIQEYFGEKLTNGSIKIVATVRDYAKNQILQKIPSKLNPSEFELKALSDNSIKKIVEDECEIHNSAYLERITDISKGNPRLALMASSIAKEKNNLDSLYDVTSLYDEYFSTIKQDLEVFNQNNFLLIIAIVSFFRVVDRHNQEQCELIKTTFNISVNDSWKDIEKLHELEIFDLYENEVVKISDQILSTYLFYKIVFVDKKISIDIFLESLFLQYKAEFKDIISPILNTFDFQYIIDALKEPVNKIWDKYSNDEQNLYHIMDAFWYLKQTDILLYFKKKITSINKEVFDVNSLNFWNKENTDILNDEILKQLVVFKDTQSVKIATELILSYFEKRPSKLSAVLQILANEYGFKHEIYQYKYEKENTLLETIWVECNKGGNELICKLFIQICRELLKVEFKDNQFTTTFKLMETNELKEIRNNMFRYLSILYEDDKYQNDIIRLIRSYPSGMGYMHEVSKVEQWDKKNIIQFIQTHFDPNIYEHVKAVNECLDGFDRHKISYELDIRNKFQHPIYELEKIMMLDSWDEFDKTKKKKLAKLIENYDLPDWELFFDQCHILFNSNKEGEYEFGNNLRDLFRILAKKNQSLYIQVLEKYLELSNPFNISINLVDLVTILGKEQSYEFLKKHSYNCKNSWLFSFFQMLPNDLTNEGDIEEILTLYQKSEQQFIPYHTKFLEKYLSIEPDIFIKITRILINRENSEGSLFINGIATIFNSNIDESQHLEKYFKNDLELLKQAYLLCLNKQGRFDYNSVSLNELVTLDGSFLKRFIHKIFEKEIVSSHDINIDLKIFWSRDDFKTVFFNILEIIFNISKSKKIWRSGEILKNFLNSPQEGEDIKNKIDCIIKKYITKFSKDEGRMVFIFEFISNLSLENRKNFIFYFLQENDSYELFKKLSLKPSFSIFSGSRVPSLQKDKDFYKSLLNNLSSIKFLKHNRYLEQKISHIEQQIKFEKKRDFMSPLN
ncbi:hypothetical protein MS2017_1301 [Bathymodiolus thermophilus thioautotrophic gill symbiont]|uniref:Novel STAND NTPase 3 domain-containing protein n=1 Tax=Bathymodiolus thermophilus thioautotrophic gill symbiont TaxID=2360 RepID=A0A3G3IMB2_9GAMM|nr:hypothetical protein [Bathymodiolus thermophilus thioautotrophic gill symbiont]AYQ56996.1 hypothetical protein MS2017_1301 [Bathymodiolus thermophilus thioautotrophic gill symbiont]